MVTNNGTPMTLNVVSGGLDIASLPDAAALDGTEALPTLQLSINAKLTAAQLKTYMYAFAVPALFAFGANAAEVKVETTANTNSIVTIRSNNSVRGYFGWLSSRFGLFNGNARPSIAWGAGTPEGAVIGDIGAVYMRTDGGANTTLYVKESGAATNTGWIAK